MKFLRMMLDNFLLNHQGALLVGAGLIGLIVNWRYDYIVGRAEAAYSYGRFQILAFGLCILFIYAGIVHIRFYKGWKKDIEEKDLED